MIQPAVESFLVQNFGKLGLLVSELVGHISIVILDSNRGADQMQN
jgi:hypothetical protein